MSKIAFLFCRNRGSSVENPAFGTPFIGFPVLKVMSQPHTLRTIHAFDNVVLLLVQRQWLLKCIKYHQLQQIMDSFEQEVPIHH